MTQTLDLFLSRWSRAGGGEMANSQSYLSELCDVLGVPRPEPKQPDESLNDYVFERMLTEDSYGTSHVRRIDLYKRDCFILESKQGTTKAAGTETLPLFGTGAGGSAPVVKKGIGLRGSDTWDAAMRRAKVQAEQYGKILPAGHLWPPFLVIVDVGYCIELWSNFARDGKAYTQFPDRNRFRIFHDEADAKGAPTLRDEKVRALLAQVWTAPMGLDPSRHSAQVTRKIAEKLAELAKSFDTGPQDATSHWQHKDASSFLMRCLFCMFAEDVGLLPERAFRDLLESMRDDTAQFVPMLSGLWREMDSGTAFSTILRKGPLREFNGKFFHDQTVLPVSRAQLELLIEAAKADWKDVEPAIFGTLLERALSPTERHKLGAHYTPRSYVERLVIPTVIEPLRADWIGAQQEADFLLAAGKRDLAYGRLVKFHQDLCLVKVLDPACGSGNFLYVTLEQMKKLEGEVLQRIADFRAQFEPGRTGGGAGQISAREGQDAVHPRQFFGIEVNKRAADVAEMVLWIGYLQWQRRTLSAADSELQRKLDSLPVLQDLGNIQNRDAVLAWDERRVKRDADGKPVTVWDGVSMKVSPVTGKEVPDESKRKEVEEIVGARKADPWPAADFVVGNPPFLGKSEISNALGLGYVTALRQAYAGEVPDSADFVMYWWRIAGRLLEQGKIRRFGFVTTNSISQAFNRRVVQGLLDSSNALALVFAIPDHPWVDSAHGAAVRIAMTVCGSSDSGILVDVDETGATSDGEAVQVSTRATAGRIHSDLRVGPNVAGAMALRSNGGLTSNGVMLGSRGFLMSDASPATGPALRPILNGNDLIQTSRNAQVIDFFGKTRDEALAWAPEAYQQVLERVKPERDTNPRKSRRERWWLFSEVMPQLRTMLDGLTRFIATPEVSKHRIFAFVSTTVLPEHPLLGIGLSDAYDLGVLCSRVHEAWSLAAGGTLEDRPRYNKTLCFEKFPFPAATDAQQARIRDLGERLDAHRKRRQALHPDLTLTGMYNVLQKLRAGEPLTDKERKIHEDGLCSLLRQIHDELDVAVFDAYGWPADLDDEALLQKLVDLNAERADEERRGLVRWLRPDFQDPTKKGKAVLTELDLGLPVVEEGDAPAVKKRARPKNPSEAVAAMQEVFAQARTAVSVADIAAQFDGWDVRGIELALQIAEGYGEVREVQGGWVKG